MSDRNTIEILRKSIAAWIDSAEAALQQAAHERREAIAFSKRFEDISAVLPMSQCPFCGGQMVDTAPLQVFGDELRVMQQYLFQNEWFTLHCLACSTYRTDAPRDSAQRWEAGTTPVRSKVFAADIFRIFPKATEVALEGATGRGWLVCLDGVWYANNRQRKKLAELWGIA
jgi:hypothetical protein